METWFAAGHPGSTDRLFTVAQMTYDRDVWYPLAIASATRQRKVLQVFSARSPEAERRAAENLFGTENWLKSMVGEYKALQDPALMAAKADDEARLRKAFVAEAGRTDPWTSVEVATRKEGGQIKTAWVVGYGYGTLFEAAGKIVELANETAQPETERLPAYRASVPDRRSHNSRRPVLKDLEIARLPDIGRGGRPSRW
jgi:hypothetical protein